MQIGDLAKKANISLRTIRYYEELGILFPAERSAGGFRRYDKKDFNKVMTIQRLKSVGLTLSEIKELFTIRKKSSVGGEAARKIYDFLEKRSFGLDERIEKFQQIKEDIEVSKELVKKCFECKRKINNCLRECNIKGKYKEVPKLFSAVI